jgi:hypothetical protein
MIGVGRRLNDRADIVRDNDTPARPQPFDGFARRKRTVDPSPAMARSTVCLAVFCNPRVPLAGVQHDGGGAGARPMSVQPPEPLQQHISRHRVCHKKVRIDIKALFASLRADYHQPRALCAGAERGKHLPI